MGLLKMSMAEPPLVETQAIHDIFISGVARVDWLGQSIYRVTLYADSYCTFDGRQERNIVARLIANEDTIMDGSAFVAARIAALKMQAANDNHQADSL